MKHLIQPSAAIIFTNWHESSPSDQDWQGISIVEAILDRSMLQLVLERTVREGCKEIHVVLGDQSLVVRDLLGSGERWGCSITYHCVHPDEKVGEFVARLQPDLDGCYWLADASSLLELRWQDGCSGAVETQGYAAYYLESGQNRWSGWAYVCGGWLTNLNSKCCFAEMESALLSDTKIQVKEVDRPLQVREFPDFLPAAMALLKDGMRFGYAPAFLPANREGIWISRDCSVNKEAILNPPLFLGRGVKVEAGVTLGPDLVVGDNCYLAREARISKSIILSQSFVGEKTDISQAVVKGSNCHHVTYKVSLKIEDACIIAPVLAFFDSSFWKARLIAQGLRFILAPVYLLIRLFSGVPSQKLLATVPAQNYAAEEIWNNEKVKSIDDVKNLGALRLHFIVTFYPGLAAVAQGQIDLVGPRIRCAEEIQALPQEWAEVYRHSRCGLIQEALLAGEESLSEDIQFMSDAFARRVPTGHSGLVLRYLIAVVRDAWYTGLKGFSIRFNFYIKQT